VYYDSPELSDYIQFRVRRSQQYKKYDLRDLLELFDIENGGGHEGAIGFRIHRTQVADYRLFIRNLIEGIEKALPV
jgi:nanoRNase/pAp phosphatase (c-di-AMP/oligoRNAs hydrolase)